jgi:hypothetical protein
MKIIIQHNFTSGLGDFICDMSEYLSLCKELKSQGYYIVLIISLYRNKYTDSPFLNCIIDRSTLNIFDEIIETDNLIGELTISGCNYYCSSQNPQKPSIHHWDIFFDYVPENFRIERYTASILFYNNIFPKVLPIFHKNILSKVEKFELEYGSSYDFFHIRTSDILDKDFSRYDLIINKIKEITKKEDKLYYLGTNNSYIYNSLRGLKNILTFDFENYDKVNNDMNAFTLFGNLNETNENSLLLNRMYNIFTEMVLVKNCETIYYFYDINWISNFLFYGFNKSNKKIKIEQINF